MAEASEKTAVILFNLGGPDGPEAVQPFLQNLFSDPAIIGAPGPIRWFLARLISRRRAPVAQEIYAHLGGGSPLLKNTREQATSLEAALNRSGGGAFRCFIAMRYWHPRAADTAKEVAAWGPDRAILLPLYPQFSTTTTESSFDEWRRAADRAGLAARESAICCYPTEPGLVTAVSDRIAPALKKFKGQGAFRVLFSAHGLPKRVVERGDPYQWQVEQTAAAAAQRLKLAEGEWRVSYQSRVGPLEWIGPATEDEIELAGREGTQLVVVPIAFVSEHSETLVELDIEYRELAEASGVPAYVRVPTVDASKPFIEGLAGLVRSALERGEPVASANGPRICPASCGKCPL